MPNRTAQSACAWRQRQSRFRSPQRDPTPAHKHRASSTNRLTAPSSPRQAKSSPSPPTAPTPADGAVLAPIPGKVTAIPIAVGQRVAKGETLIVLEAMKMEYTLSAPFDGTVAAINASSGEQVTEGTVLVEIAEENQ